MILRVALAVVFAALAALPAMSWAQRIPTVEEVCGKWLGGTTEDAEKWLACRRAYERGETPRVGATTPTQVYCPIEVGPYDVRYKPRTFLITNRGNGVAMGVQVTGSYPVSGPGGGTVVMNRAVKFIDRLKPLDYLTIWVENPIPGEVYTATVSACVPTQ